MRTLPSYAQVADRSVTALYGLIRQHAASTLATPPEHAWQRDASLLRALDEALLDVGCGRAPECEGTRPRWLAGLVARELRAGATSSWSRDRFLRIRLIERLGLVELEPDDTYVLAMVSGLGSDKVGVLREDPELVDRALWRVFEVEGGGEVSLTNIDRFGRDGWRNAFVTLANDGTLDRERVQEACLDALRRDFAAYRAGWYAATYLALAPTTPELVRDQGRLRALLGAAVPATVSFAVKHLFEVHRAGALEVTEALAALPPVTTGHAKGTALQAIRLAAAYRQQDSPAVAVVAQAGLESPHPEVQLKAANLLAACGVGSVVAAHGELAESVKHHLGLPATPRPEHLPPAPQQLSPPAEPVSPADLVERAGALLEDPSDVPELEAVLAALADPRTHEVLEPLRRRAAVLLQRAAQHDEGTSGLPGQLAQLVLRLLGESAPAAAPSLSAQAFLVHRLAELADARRHLGIDGGVGPLLATPDLPGGWVSPAALVDRLARTATPRHHDLVAAVLRLHPDGRREWGGQPGLPAAVQFAITGREPTRGLLSGGRVGPRAWWVAAERSRGPYAVVDAPAVVSELREHSWVDGGRERSSRYVHFDIQSPGVCRRHTDRPTELPPTELGQAALSDRLGFWVPWIAAIWPHDAEHFLALTCLPVLESPGWTESTHDASRVLDALARHPGRLGTLTAYTLATGLSAADRITRFHAVDAVVDLTVSGRIPATELATAMASNAPAWPTVRWAETLASVSKAPGGARTTIDLLTALLPRLATDHRGLNTLLELLRELTLRIQEPVVDPGFRHWLGSLSGRSAAATAARQLLH